MVNRLTQETQKKHIRNGINHSIADTRLLCTNKIISKNCLVILGAREANKCGLYCKNNISKVICSLQVTEQDFIIYLTFINLRFYKFDVKLLLGNNSNQYTIDKTKKTHRLSQNDLVKWKISRKTRRDLIHSMKDSR